ncbi:ABC transporter ATP-binding protein/permease [Streptococcus pneumoniae]|nr:ABC transporter ATP-binding protein/permease [Streptococcus pneumoniae]
MKTVQFFWHYFKVYKFSFVVVILMIVLAKPSFQSFLDKR